MYISTYQFQVCYSDTDQMGFMHHSNYAKYYENARWKAFDDLGISYKHIEDCGYIMPVVSMNQNFIKPALYSDTYSIKTHIKACKGAKIDIVYKIFNNKDEVINTASIRIASVSRKTGKPVPLPDFVIDGLENKKEVTSG